MLTPEQNLWRAVLGQAYADAEAASGEIEAADFQPIARGKARRFLRADTQRDAASLAVICDFAEVPYDRVVGWARGRYIPICLSKTTAA